MITAAEVNLLVVVTAGKQYLKDKECIDEWSRHNVRFMRNKEQDT